MTSIPTLNNVALVVLRRAPVLHAPTAGNGPTSDRLVATANGIPNVEARRQPRQSRASLSDALFDANRVGALQVKLHLFERLGQELGIDQRDYGSHFAYGTAIKRVVGAIRLQADGGFARVRAIKEDLALDKLGVSLDTVVNAIIDPGGKDDRKLDGALARQAKDERSGKAEASTMVRTVNVSRPAKIDEIGIYSV